MLYHITLFYIILYCITLCVYICVYIYIYISLCIYIYMYISLYIHPYLGKVIVIPSVFKRTHLFVPSCECFLGMAEDIKHLLGVDLPAKQWRFVNYIYVYTYIHIIYICIYIYIQSLCMFKTIISPQGPGFLRRAPWATPPPRAASLEGQCGSPAGGKALVRNLWGFP